MTKKDQSFLKKGTIIFLVGFSFLLIGGLFFFDYVSGASSKTPRGSSGFSFSSYPNWSIDKLSFNVKIHPQKGIIGLRTSFVSGGKNNYYVAFFTHFNISSRKTLLSRDADVVKWDFWNSGNGSLIVATFSVTGNATKVPTSEAEFNVTNPIILRNFGSYTLDIPFGSIPSLDVRDLENNLPVHFSAFPDYYLLLHVSIPLNGILVKNTEEINDRRFLEDSQLLEFNIYELNSFILEYTIPNEANQYQLKLFLSGLLLGVGIPMTFQSSLKWLFNPKHPKETHLDYPDTLREIVKQLYEKPAPPPSKRALYKMCLGSQPSLFNNRTQFKDNLNELISRQIIVIYKERNRTEKYILSPKGMVKARILKTIDEL